MKREGSLKRCPICRAALTGPPDAYGGVRCPRCSGQLWRLALPSGPTFFEGRPGESIYDLMADLADRRLGLTAAHLEESLRDADPLDVVEILAGFEDALRS